jgi:hypothetical protein
MTTNAIKNSGKEIGSMCFKNYLFEFDVPVANPPLTKTPISCEVTIPNFKKIEVVKIQILSTDGTYFYSDN